MAVHLITLLHVSSNGIESNDVPWFMFLVDSFWQFFVLTWVVTFHA